MKNLVDVSSLYYENVQIFVLKFIKSFFFLGASPSRPPISNTNIATRIWLLQLWLFIFGRIWVLYTEQNFDILKIVTHLRWFNWYCFWHVLQQNLHLISGIFRRGEGGLFRVRRYSSWSESRCNSTEKCNTVVKHILTHIIVNEKYIQAKGLR